MLTGIKKWFKGLFAKTQITVSKPVAEILEKAEPAGWDKYHQMMMNVSTELEANLSKTLSKKESVNDQITDSVTQAAPKPKKKPAAKKTPTMKADKPAKTKTPKNSK
jgi:hypothetical protein